MGVFDRTPALDRRSNMSARSLRSDNGYCSRALDWKCPFSESANAGRALACWLGIEWLGVSQPVRVHSTGGDSDLASEAPGYQVCRME
jgi:hypothetical protein